VRFKTRSDAPDLHTQLESLLDQVWKGVRLAAVGSPGRRGEARRTAKEAPAERPRPRPGGL